MSSVPVTAENNPLKAILDALKQKPHCTITVNMSVTNGVINNTTVSVEGADTEEELVLKTFGMLDGAVEGARELARSDGYTPTIPEALANTKPKAGK